MIEIRLSRKLARIDRSETLAECGQLLAMRQLRLMAHVRPAAQRLAIAFLTGRDGIAFALEALVIRDRLLERGFACLCPGMQGQE